MFNPQPKPEYFRSAAYLSWLRKQPPIGWGHGPVEAHHVKMFRNGGTGIKPPDNDAIPIRKSAHLDIGNSGEIRVLCERFGYTRESLRELCDGYYARWQKECNISEP